MEGKIGLGHTKEEADKILQELEAKKEEAEKKGLDQVPPEDVAEIIKESGEEFRKEQEDRWKEPD
ncbi:MAG: hypothetical protein NTW98_02825 [Candidatus Nomurabacteria bacterium]|nr:hypothetical protein [Candidatus Nomurabacteria bacterium]